MQRIRKPQQYKTSLAVACAALAVVALWWLWAVYGVRRMYWAVAPIAASAPTVSELGQVGDLFGGINALFAAFAVVGVFWAGYLQRRALIETQQALSDERAANERQQFEATFYQLVSLFRAVLQSCVLQRPRSPPMTGSTAASFDEVVEMIVGDTRELRGAGMTKGYWEVVLNHHRARVHEVFTLNEAHLGPLFRTLAAVFEHVETIAARQPGQAMHHSEIMRDQLSNSLLILFAYDALTFNTERFHSLILRFFLLAPLRHQGLRVQALFEAFPPQAFGMQGDPTLEEAVQPVVR